MTSEARAKDDFFIVQKIFDLSALEAEAAKRLRNVARSRPSNWGHALRKYYHWVHHTPRGSLQPRDQAVFFSREILKPGRSLRLLH